MAAAVLFVLFLRRSNTSTVAEGHAPPVSASDIQPAQTNNQSPQTNRLPMRRAHAKRSAEFTEAEKTELAKKFKERFKPAIARWCKAYSGRVPFQPDDVTLDKFHSLLGYNMFTFMVNGDTLTIVDAKDGAKVCYLSHAGTLNTLNSIPTSGTVPDLSVPVNRDEIISMVKADTGVNYRPDQVEISPTGAANTMGGGAFVHVGRVMMGGGELITGTNVTMVFAPGGQLVQYEGPVL